MEREKKRRRLAPRLKVLGIILGALLMLCIAAFIYINIKLEKLGTLAPEQTPIAEEGMAEDEIYEQDDVPAGSEQNESAEEMEPEDVVWAEDPVDLEAQSMVTNILLIGQDRRPEESGTTRSDAIMIVSMNAETKKVTLVSIMRDTYVQIPGHVDNRINAAYRFGGASLLCETIEKNFGLKIDGTVGVDFSGFVDVINAVGGVDIDLTSAEAEHLSGVHPNLHAGLNRLNGEEALSYSRIRHLAGGDRMRTQRQRNVITSLINRFKSSSLTELNKLIDTVLPLVSTDLGNLEIMHYAVTALTMDLGDLRSHAIPVEGAYKSARIRGMAVYVPDLGKTREALAEMLHSGG